MFERMFCVIFDALRVGSSLAGFSAALRTVSFGHLRTRTTRIDDDWVIEGDP
jgi:hypothetical protein